MHCIGAIVIDAVLSQRSPVLFQNRQGVDGLLSAAREMSEREIFCQKPLLAKPIGKTYTSKIRVPNFSGTVGWPKQVFSVTSSSIIFRVFNPEFEKKNDFFFQENCKKVIYDEHFTKSENLKNTPICSKIFGIF